MIEYIIGLSHIQTSRLCALLLGHDPGTASDFCEDWGMAEGLLTAIVSGGYMLQFFGGISPEIAANLVAPNGYQQAVFSGTSCHALASAAAFVAVQVHFGVQWDVATPEQMSQISTFVGSV